MYAAPYGFGPGNNSQPFNPNGVPPQPHTPLQQQQPQHMMYNQQQYAPGPGPHQSPYVTPGPGMGGNAGGMGMMQNNGLAQMSPGHVASYQTPYSSSPYGASIPTPSAGSLPPNFMPAPSNGQSFPMNAPNMNPQQQQQQLLQPQRMQPPPPSSTPTQSGQRASPYGGMQQNTPPTSSQPQFAASQNPNQTQMQISINSQQSQGGTVVTPQTPNFPPLPQGAANSGSNMVPPLSPRSEYREKEIFTLLLEINRELLMEVMRLQAAQQVEKKEELAASTTSPGGQGEKDKADKSKAASGKECMRRLQSNLAYLAAMANRSHKPSSQIPAHPAIMTAPPLTPRPSKRSGPSTSSPGADKGIENASEEKNLLGEESSEDRVELLKDLYKRLHALFPDVDPKKDTAIQSGNAATRTQAQAQAQAQAQMQAKHQLQQGHPPGGGPDQNQQQKMQNDMLRQKMMQQAQAQALGMQQGMQPGMQQGGMHYPGQGQVQNR